MSSERPCADECVPKTRMSPENNKWRSPKIRGSLDVDDEPTRETQGTDEPSRPPALECVVRRLVARLSDTPEQNARRHSCHLQPGPE